MLRLDLDLGLSVILRASVFHFFFSFFVLVHLVWRAWRLRVVYCNAMQCNALHYMIQSFDGA